MAKYYILLLFLLNSCIGIPTDYPENEYYTLSKENLNFEFSESFPYSIYIDEVSISSEYEDVFIKYTDEDSKVEKYHYHRWIDSPSNLIQNYFNNLMIKSKIFENGVFTSKRRIIPDLMLNIEILDLSSYEDYVELTINFTVIKYDKINSENTLFYQKYFNKKTERESSKANSIPVAFNKAIQELSKDFIDEFYIKLQND